MIQKNMRPHNSFFGVKIGLMFLMLSQNITETTRFCLQNCISREHVHTTYKCVNDENATTRHDEWIFPVAGCVRMSNEPQHICSNCLHIISVYSD